MSEGPAPQDNTSPDQRRKNSADLKQALQQLRARLYVLSPAVMPAVSIVSVTVIGVAAHGGISFMLPDCGGCGPACGCWTCDISPSCP